MKRNTALASLGLVLLLQVAIHLAIGEKWFYVDEQSILATSWLMQIGDKPYVDFAYVHMPGAGYVGYLFFSLFGTSILSARFASLLASLLTTIIIFYIARKAFDDQTALSASFLFVLLSPALLSFQLLAEPYLTLFISSCFLFLYLYNIKPALRYAALAGLSGGLAFIFKQPGALSLPIGIVILWLCKSGPPEKKSSLISIATFIVFFLLPISFLILYYILLGSLEDLLYNTIYTFLLTPGYKAHVLTPVGFIFLLSSISLLYILIHFRKSSTNAPTERKAVVLVLLGWFLASLSNAIPRLTTHHFLAILPVTAIAGACFLLSEKNSFIYVLGRGIVIFSFFFMFSASITAFASNGSIHGGDFIPSHILDFEYRQAAEYVASKTDANESILGMPNAPLYFISKRRPAAYWHYSGSWSIDYEVGERLLHDLETNAPAYIAYLTHNGYNMSILYPSVDEYVLSNYHVERTFLLGHSKATGTIDGYIFIMARNDRD